MPDDEISHRNPDDATAPASSDPADGPSGSKKSAQTPTTAESRRSVFTRRGLLALGGVVGAGVVAAAIVAESNATSAPVATPTPTPNPARTFTSTNLTTEQITATQSGETAPGLLFVEPQTKTFNGLIMENSGEPVWIGPTGVNMTDLRTQEFEGKPVLTYWSGKSLSGHGVGIGNILDDSYTLITHVQTVGDMQADLHEFHLTPRGSALMTAYPTVKADLSSVGGPTNGYLLNCHIQEVDIRTGKLLLDWSAIDHVDLTETYATVKNPADGDGTTAAKAFDAYHLNAIDFDDDTLLISSRHTHTIYSIDRSTGAMRWRMGGKKSDFTIDKDAQFAWQHHVRHRPNGMISIFNNESRTTGANAVSSGLLLAVDEQARTVKLHKKLLSDKLLSIAEGSVQLLPNGNVLVGWGIQPVVTEFDSEGRIVYQATKVGQASYRSFRDVWVAHPKTVPDVEVTSESDGTMKVYVSWNGATEVRNWQVVAGADANSLKPVVIAPRTGFETSVSVAHAPAVAVQALDFGGNVLATSAVHTA
jgi:Arylsulfotransferase (ASST)